MPIKARNRMTQNEGQRIADRLMASVTPWLRPSQEAYFERVGAEMRPNARLLDLGCGKEFLINWLRPDLLRRYSAAIIERSTIFGIDPDFPSLKENASR